MEQQTAVEWLEREITRRGPKENNPPQWLKELYEQAKEMEKQRLEKFYKFGLTDGYNDSFEQHYKETYKNN